MSLWVDKYRPNAITKLSLHENITPHLISLARSEELPHLLFYGPPGAGKKTRVMCLLREIYGPAVEKIKLEYRSFKTPTNKTIDITTLGSNYHIECNPSDAGSNDRFIIQEVIKEIASHSNINSSAGPNSRSFKIVVLNEVDRLSKQAQAGLRRTMEKYSSQCRIILLCNSPSKIIEPVRSRCLGIRIPSPTHEQISSLLMQIGQKESCPCPLDLAMRISLNSERNVRRAILMLEASKVQNTSIVLDNASGGGGGATSSSSSSSSSTASASSTPTLISSPLTDATPVLLPDWELYICRIAREILEEQSPSRLMQVRDMLYELLTNCIPPDVIVSVLTRELMKALDDSLKHELIHWSSYYEHRIRLGSKPIFHLEALVAKFMSVYKKWIIDMFG